MNTKNYFETCKTVAEIKAQFIVWAKKLHPDVTGKDTNRLFQDMSNQYQKALKNCDGIEFPGSDGKSHKYYYNEVLEQDVATVIKTLLSFKMPEYIKIELVGTWVWVSGTKREDKYTQHQLKSIDVSGQKMIWHSQRCKWYWRKKSYKATHFSDLPFEELKAMYGHKEFEQEQDEKVQVAA